MKYMKERSAKRSSFFEDIKKQNRAVTKVPRTSIIAPSPAIYSNHRDFIANSCDLDKLPTDCDNGSTCITTDTKEEYVFHKNENVWKKEKRSLPRLIYRGIYDRINLISFCPCYGDFILVQTSEMTAYAVYYNGIEWIELEREKEKEAK